MHRHKRGKEAGEKNNILENVSDDNWRQTVSWERKGYTTLFDKSVKGFKEKDVLQKFYVAKSASPKFYIKK